jgi:hypothetical protein
VVFGFCLGARVARNSQMAIGWFDALNLRLFGFLDALAFVWGKE